MQQKKQILKPNRHLEMAEEIVRFSGDFSGLKILDIGGEGMLARELMKLCPEIAEFTVINPVIKENKVEGKIILKNGDSRKLEYPDNYFDRIVSFASFEHFFDFDIAVDELYRVLKPGGTLYTKFGPLWSSQLGHHLWMHYEGQLYSFQNVILPAFCHLRFEPAELRAWLEKKYGDKALANRITTYVYRCQDQNRMFFSDYEQIIDKSKFEKLFFIGHQEFPVNPAALEGENYDTILRQIKKKYPDKYGYGYSAISMLLTK